jgi:hypothetical protein
MRAAALLAALALVAAPAAAQEPPAQGRVWKGTLGDKAITACFAEEFTRDGLYYLDEAREPLRLVEVEEADPPTYTELSGRSDETGAVWAMQAPQAGRLIGTWTKGGEIRQIDLTANAVTLPGYGTACETGAFLDPLLADGTYSAGPASFEGTAYTRFEYQGPARMGLDDYQITSLALEPVRPGDTAINRALAQALPDGTAGHMMGQCVGASLGDGHGGYAEELLAPILITPRWLGIRHSGSSYCGGAYPNHFSTFAVYDRDSGAEVDPAIWFKSGMLGFYDFEAELDPKPAKRPIAGLSGDLAKAVLARWPVRDEGHECGVPDMIGSTSWEIGVIREGPVFVPQLPHAILACAEEVVLPWKAARPLLSAEGRTVMDSLR